jgi:hypothetical protein
MKPTYTREDVALLIDIINDDEITDSNIQEHIKRLREMRETVIEEKHLYERIQFLFMMEGFKLVDHLIWHNTDKLIGKLNQ